MFRVMKKSRHWTIAASVVLLAGLTAGLTFAFRPAPGRPFVKAAPVGKLRVSIPRGFYRSIFHDGLGRTPFPPSGAVLTDAPVGDARLGDWFTNGPPANQVGLFVNEWFAIGPPPGNDRLRFPLGPRRRWIRLANGMKVGSVRFANMDYEVAYWVGPDAPANDRVALLRALRSIRPGR
jgi:hypothetical protein